MNALVFGIYIFTNAHSCTVHTYPQHVLYHMWILLVCYAGINIQEIAFSMWYSVNIIFLLCRPIDKKGANMDSRVHCE